MKDACLCAIVVAICIAPTNAFAQSPSVDESPTPSVVVGGLDLPAGIAFGFGKMFVTERSGTLRVVENGELLDEPLATFETTIGGETGALGVAVPPGNQDRGVYVFVTEADGSSNTIWRVPIDGGEPERVIEGIPAFGIHNGGGLAFDDEGSLFVSNGEQGDAEKAQNPQVLGGKVYRFTASGGIPADNPFPGSPTYSYGHRNPFGLAIDPLTGTPWVSENGPSSFDEINRIEKGGNYGWPNVSGPGCDDACIDPVLFFEEVIVPTGIAFASEDAPRSVAGHLFFASYRNGQIYEAELDPDRSSADGDRVIVDDEESIVALAWGPRGLYYSTDSAVKVVPVGGGSGVTDPAGPGTGVRDEESDKGFLGLVLVGAVLLLLLSRSRRHFSG
jgi:glucose/arabinose dehydrogenase